MTGRRILSLVPRREADVVPADSLDFSRYQAGDVIIVTMTQQCEMGPEVAAALPAAILAAARKAGLSVTSASDPNGDIRVTFGDRLPAAGRFA